MDICDFRIVAYWSRGSESLEWHVFVSKPGMFLLNFSLLPSSYLPFSILVVH